MRLDQARSRPRTRRMSIGAGLASAETGAFSGGVDAAGKPVSSR